MTLSGFLIGGAIPAICLGLGTVFMRASLRRRRVHSVLSDGVGSVVALLGWASLFWTGGAPPTVRPVLFAAAIGTTWTAAIACMAYGTGVLKLPVSIIAPLTNSNALVEEAAAYCRIYADSFSARRFSSRR